MVITSCTRNAVVLYWARGFESHTLRQKFTSTSGLTVCGLFSFQRFFGEYILSFLQSCSFSCKERLFSNSALCMLPLYQKPKRIANVQKNFLSTLKIIYIYIIYFIYPHTKQFQSADCLPHSSVPAHNNNYFFASRIFCL